MFLALIAYSSVFVSASSLLVTTTNNGAVNLLLCHVFIFAVLCVYMASKGDLFGWAVVHHPYFFNNYVAPFIAWLLQYLLTCPAPLLVGSAPCEFGPRAFSSLVVWNSLANGVIIYVGMSFQENRPFLNMTNGMVAYGCTLLLLAIGLFTFFRNTKEVFEVSLF